MCPRIIQKRPLSKKKLGIALEHFNRSSQLLKNIYDLGAAIIAFEKRMA